MKKALIILSKILASILVLVVVLLGVAAWLVNSESVQNKVQKRAMEMLSEKLGTEVSIDKVSIDVWRGRVNLYDLVVMDQNEVRMLEVDTLRAALDPMKAINKEIEIDDAELLGCRARLYMMYPDTVANYQFVLDSLKRKSGERPTSTKVKNKKKLQLDISKVVLRNIDVQYDTKKVKRAPIPNKDAMSRMNRKLLNQLKTDTLVEKTLKQHFHLGELKYQKGRFASHGKASVNIRELLYQSDNELPRKNTGKKHRGWYDPGHMDVTADMDVAVDYMEGDSIHLTLVNCTATDTVTGIDIRNLEMKAVIKNGVLQLKDIFIRQGETTLNIDEGIMVLPSKKAGRRLAFITSKIKGKTLLKDISRPFAPPLNNFVMPLEFETVMSGTDSVIYFNDAYVYTPDSLFQVWAKGSVSGLTNKYDLLVHFDVNRMKAVGNVKKRIIDQFPVKKFMMSQLRKLGTLRFKGHLNVYWRKEQFDGFLNTGLGGMWVNFYLDEINKYVVGNVSTDSINLAKLTDMKSLGKLAMKADFKFDISKPRTAEMRRRIGGKLPMGNVDAMVIEASYKKIKLHNIHATIKSNGAIAEGEIINRGKRIDALCKFSFTNSDSLSKMKIRPSLKFHSLSDEDKQKNENEKARKAEEKARKKAAERAEKEKRNAEKARIKAEKKAAKDAEKAEKARIKAEEKAAKEAEKARKKAEEEKKKAEEARIKAEKKAAKEAEKARKKAEKERQKAEKQQAN